jgi:hypothetical protein
MKGRDQLGANKHVGDLPADGRLLDEAVDDWAAFPETREPALSSQVMPTLCWRPVESARRLV